MMVQVVHLFHINLSFTDMNVWHLLHTYLVKSLEIESGMGTVPYKDDNVVSLPQYKTLV